MEEELLEIKLNISFIVDEIKALRNIYENKNDPLPIKAQADLHRYSESLLFLSQAYRLIGAGDIGKKE